MILYSSYATFYMNEKFSPCMVDAVILFSTFSLLLQCRLRFIGLIVVQAAKFGG